MICFSDAHKNSGHHIYIFFLFGYSTKEGNQTSETELTSQCGVGGGPGFTSPWKEYDEDSPEVAGRSSAVWFMGRLIKTRGRRRRARGRPKGRAKWGGGEVPTVERQEARIGTSKGWGSTTASACGVAEVPIAGVAPWTSKTIDMDYGESDCLFFIFRNEWLILKVQQNWWLIIV